MLIRASERETDPNATVNPDVVDMRDPKDRALVRGLLGKQRYRLNKHGRKRMVQESFRNYDFAADIEDPKERVGAVNDTTRTLLAMDKMNQADAFHEDDRDKPQVAINLVCVTVPPVKRINAN